MGGGGESAASRAAWRRSRRETEALESLAAPAIWQPGSLRRRRARTRATRSGWRVVGEAWGREERSAKPAVPSARQRASHLKTVRMQTLKAPATSATG